MNNILQTILFVEDEPDIQRVVKLALEAMASLQVIVCSSGEEALMRAAQSPVDLLLLDVMMPQMDGPTTLRRLRELPMTANTPAVFMTAKAHPTEIAQFQAMGAVDVIAKPFDPLTLATTLQTIWARVVVQNMDVAPGVVTARDVAIENAHENSRAQQNEMSPETRFAERMRALTVQFHQELPVRLDTLRQLWAQLSLRWNAENLENLHRNAHHLAGTGATFGYGDLTTRARALDRHLKILMQKQDAPELSLQQEIHARLIELENELERIIAQVHACKP